MDEPLVKIEHLTKSFSPQNPPALDEINVNIPKGQFVGLAGPDGAGKTTLIRLIGGLFLPTKGKISVAGYNSVKEAECIHRLAGYMPQKFGLYEDLTVMENLNLYADLRGVLGEDREKTYKELLRFTALAPFVDRLAGDLSGGMKQKLGLACALIKKPSLLLLDEPSVGVDPISRRELWKMVQNLIDEGISVIWSTAYLDEAEKCHTVLLLNEGKLLFQGDPKDLTGRVKDRVFKVSNIQGSRRVFLQKALQEEAVVDGVIQGSDVRIVIKDAKDNHQLNKFIDKQQVKVESVSPRFEDAFIDILGGGPKGVSLLAENTPKIEDHHQEVVQAKELTKNFGNFTAADHISFEIKPGEIFGLLGPNGAGKSTTFKMLCGLLKPTFGQAFVNDLNLQVAPGKARAQIGYMAQKFSLYGDLSVLQNLNFFSGIYNLKGNRQKDAVNKMIEIFSLENYVDVSAGTLPLGFKQRVALACAAMHRPPVLFLDEPTSGVDPITRREFWNHINGLVEKGITVMVTTHFMDEAEYCDRIALIYRSKMIKMGTPDELKALAINETNKDPTLEDAFIQLIQEYDRENPP